MKVKKNIRCEASDFYQILKEELRNDIKANVKQKNMPKVIQEGYHYRQSIHVGGTCITPMIYIQTLKENTCYCIEAQYPKYTQIISYTFHPLDEHSCKVMYRERMCHCSAGIWLLSFMKSHLYRMKIEQFIHHIETKAINKQSKKKQKK